MNAAVTLRLALAAALAATTGACATARNVGVAPGSDRSVAGEQDLRTPEEMRRDSLAVLMERARAAVPASPYVAQPTTTLGARVWRTAATTKGMRLVVSTEARALWLMKDSTVLFTAPVAVGMETGFTWAGKKYDFQTPLGRRRVLGKETSPVWTPPDWHYYEIALERKLQVVQMRKGQRYTLSDSSRLEIRGNDVGRVNQGGHFYAFPAGNEIIFDGKVFVPPIGTNQRRVPDVLGTHKLVMGDGYLIHGTNQETSIGDAVSHGCVRMYNEDVERLYEMVPVGTPVFIY